MSTGLFARSKSLFVNYFASLLGGGVITAIALATKVTEPAQRTAFYAARMVMFSRTARMFQGGEIAALVRLYEFGVKASFLILAPILWWVGLHAHAIVDLAFGHGAIAAREVRLVGSVLIALIPSVLFLGVNQLLSNAFYAMDRIKIPALIMPAGTLLYAAAAGPASAAFGAPGLTLTTTLVSVVLFLLLLSLLARALPGLRAGRTLLRVAGYCAWSGVCLVGCTWIVQAAWPDALVAAVVSLPAGIALYGGMLLLLRDRTLLRILETGREIFSRRVTA
jgi:peptidoglycan biosynthesis protein MviN/MurJ (putative lipid II flippase)